MTSNTTDVASPQNTADSETASQMAQHAFAELVRATRSHRRYDARVPVSKEQLNYILEMARNVPSAINRQPLRYRVVSDAATCEAVFQTLGWALGARGRAIPEPGQRPSAYLVICDTEQTPNAAVDRGIAAQTIMLAARAVGLGSCMLHTFNKARAAEVLELPEAAPPVMVIALGVSTDVVQLEGVESSPDGSLANWDDEAGVHHVPKRSLADMQI
ncbi:nitroreductase family protein [Collinsella sp. zg1085]|uniref:nitroreductase family protein n=1 Tax=Collinsella sp. zg1085 TaxID=2844380 RepID=UPI001C0B77A5|nr:nitroreductase family protein [Collinsella sp. zg1085]QWT17933.1 nitroreductase family protein [Collinsella sp. zg1085]